MDISSAVRRASHRGASLRAFARGSFAPSLLTALGLLGVGCESPGHATGAQRAAAPASIAHSARSEEVTRSEVPRAIAAAEQLVAVMELEIAAITTTESTLRAEIARLELAADGVVERTAQLQRAVDGQAKSSGATIAQLARVVGGTAGGSDDALAISRRTRELQHATVALRAQWQAFQSRRAAEVRGEVAMLEGDPPSLLAER